jgi:hypothetical protein
MERKFHDEPTQQPSLFNFVAPPQGKDPQPSKNRPEEAPHPNEVYIALDRLLEALENLLQGDHLLRDELRQRLSNPTLEALIFEDVSKNLILE